VEKITTIMEVFSSGYYKNMKIKKLPEYPSSENIKLHLQTMRWSPFLAFCGKHTPPATILLYIILINNITI